jgi:hypothetical protein
MWERRVRLATLRVVVIVLSALGLLVLGIALATGALRGEAAHWNEDSLAEPAIDWHSPDGSRGAGAHRDGHVRHGLILGSRLPVWEP